MPANNTLKEMENQVTKGATPAEPMPKAPNYVPQAGTVEDLGGPTPTNSRPDDESNKYSTPAKTIKQVKDVVNAKASSPDPMPTAPNYVPDSGKSMRQEEEEAPEGDVVAEEPAVEEDEEVVVEQELDLSQDVQALLEGEELSEEFQEKARTIFEATVRSKISEAVTALDTRYEKALVEQVEEIKKELVERIDSYIEYVAQEWITENALQVETGIRSELSESFMSGLKGLFEEHYVQIPDDKYDVLEAMVEKLDEMETKLNEQIDTNVGLTKRLSESVSNNILDEISEGLALSQKEKLASLADGVEFESEEQYREKLSTLKDSYFAPKKVEESQEVISEGAVVEDNSSAMQAYLNAVTKFQ